MTAAVCAVSLGSTILVYLAWTRYQHNSGTTQDADLWILPAKLHYAAVESIHDNTSSVAKVVDVMGNLDLYLGIRSWQSFVHCRSTTPVHHRPRLVELNSIIRRRRCSSACDFAVDASRRGR